MSIDTLYPRFAPVPELPQKAKYWGTIYGTSGERIGTAFVGEDDDTRVVLPRLTSAPMSYVRPRSRVFVGQIQDSWGLHGCAVKEVEDESRLGSDMGKGKGKAKGKKLGKKSKRPGFEGSFRSKAK